jgi:hypothetical protein
MIPPARKATLATATMPNTPRGVWGALLAGGGTVGRLHSGSFT